VREKEQERKSERERKIEGGKEREREEGRERKAFCSSICPPSNFVLFCA